VKAEADLVAIVFAGGGNGVPEAKIAVRIV
jgi:hypothetical protein